MHRTSLSGRIRAARRFLVSASHRRHQLRRMRRSNCRRLAAPHRHSTPPRREAMSSRRRRGWKCHTRGVDPTFAKLTRHWHAGCRSGLRSSHARRRTSRWQSAAPPPSPSHQPPGQRPSGIRTPGRRDRGDAKNGSLTMTPAVHNAVADRDRAHHNLYSPIRLTCMRHVLLLATHPMRCKGADCETSTAPSHLETV